MAGGPDPQAHDNANAELRAHDKAMSNKWPKIHDERPLTQAQKARAEAKAKKIEAQQAWKAAQVEHSKANTAWKDAKAADQHASAAESAAQTKEAHAKDAHTKAAKTKSPMAKIAAQEKASDKTMEAKHAREEAVAARSNATKALLKAFGAQGDSDHADRVAAEKDHAAKVADDHAAKLEKEAPKVDQHKTGWGNDPLPRGGPMKLPFKTENDTPKTPYDSFKLATDQPVYTAPAHNADNQLAHVAQSTAQSTEPFKLANDHPIVNKPLTGADTHPGHAVNMSDHSLANDHAALLDTGIITG